MRYCPSCKINIEGAHKQCPLCQNGLHGEAELPVYPLQEELRRGSVLYKTQLLVFISIALICAVIDLVLELTSGIDIYWSIIVITWVIGGELCLKGYIRKHNNISWMISHGALWLVILTLITSILVGIHPIYVCWILPSMAIAVEILHFVFMMLDKAHNAMIYLLGNSLICVLCAIIYICITKEKNIMWLSVLLTCSICIIGAIIFKGRRVSQELLKRFHV